MSGVEQTRDKEKKKVVDRMLSAFSEEEVLVVVEGQHDVVAFRRVGIEAVTYHQLLAGKAVARVRIFYLVLDRDKGGEERERKIVAHLRERYPTAVINTAAGTRLLKLLGATSTEQVAGPINNLMRNANGELTGVERIGD